MRTLPIPDAVIQASTSAQTVASQGLFPEIERAWIIIDSQLYLWNYLEGNSSAFESYVHPTDVIQSVSLVTPKAGVFIDSIKHLLLISTQQSLNILGLARELTSPPNARHELRLYQTDFSLQTSGVVLSDAVATKDGSRVFCRGNDACLFELVYQAKEGWFSSKCTLKNLTSSGVKNLLPQWAGGVSKETMDTLTIDHSRGLLYASLSKRSIIVYSISAKTNAPPQHVATLRDIFRTASLISPNNASLLRQEEFCIISLQPIHSDESRSICLLAITSNGVRLYFTNQRSGYRAFTTPSSSPGGTSTLELLYVRPPPAAALNPMPTPAIAFGVGSHSDYPPVQPPLQHISHALYRNGVLLAAGPYAYENGLDNILGIGRSTASSSLLNNTSVCVGSIGNGAAFVPTTSAPTAALPTDAAEQTTDVLVHGATWALAEVPRDQSAPLNPLVSQLTSLPRTFLVLTSSGLTVLVERRPIDLLRDLLERTSAAAGSCNAEAVGLVDVFKRYGQAQSCAMALAIATRNSHLGVSVEALLSVRPSTSGAFSTQMFTTESVANAARTYFDYGGAPRYEPPPYPHQPVGEGRVVLSGRHDGLGVYAASLVGLLWDKPVKEVGKGVGRGSPSLQTGKDLEELRSFVRTHGEALGIHHSKNGGGSGSEAAYSEGEALALRAEQESLRAIYSLLERVIEALSFVTLIGDFGWNRVLSKTTGAVKEKVEAMKFSDLVLELSSTETDAGSLSIYDGAATALSQHVSRALVEALIDLHSHSSTGGMDVIADLLQAQCPSFCDANDVRVYKALECIRQAKDAGVGPRREEALRESEMLMLKAGRHLPQERLEEVVKLWREMEWVGGAIHLPLSCVSQWHPHGVTRASRQDGMPAGDRWQTAYDRAMRCYGLVLDTLKHLDENVENFRRESKGANAAAAVDRAESLRATAYAIAQQSPDTLLHEALYDFLLQSGRREQLLELRTPFLEAYLQQEPLTLEKLDLLWQCYTRRGEGASAARVLVGLAESNELELTLYQRLEYLTLAANNARSSTAVGATGTSSGYATISFVAEIEEKLEVAQVQVEIYRAVKELSNLDEEKKVIFLEDLDSNLLDISTLYHDFADPLSLYDVKILIFQVSEFRDADLVVTTWENILDRAHDEGTRLLAPERAYERVAAVVVELGRRFMRYEFACPVDALTRNLESYALTQRSLQRDMPKFWAVQTLLAATAPPEAIFDTLEALFQSKAEPWQTKGAIAFLLTDIHHLLAAWMAAYLSVSSPYDDAITMRVSGKRSSKAFTSSAALFDLSSIEGANSALCDVEATSALVAAVARTSSSSSSTLNFPARRIDDALDAYLVNLNSLASSSSGLRDEQDAKLARDTLNAMKTLQDRLRGIF